MTRRPDALDWHRRHYGVPARRGVRVVVDGQRGTIIGASGPHVRVRFDDWQGPAAASGRKWKVAACHPTWRVDYLDGRDYSAEHDARVEAFVDAINRGRVAA